MAKPIEFRSACNCRRLPRGLQGTWQAGSERASCLGFPSIFDAADKTWAPGSGAPGTFDAVAMVFAAIKTWTRKGHVIYMYALGRHVEDQASEVVAKEGTMNIEFPIPKL